MHHDGRDLTAALQTIREIGDPEALQRAVSDAFPGARLIIQASQHCQVWVVSHASRLIAALQQDEGCNSIVLEKVMGQTQVVGQRVLDEPAWHWPS